MSSKVAMQRLWGAKVTPPIHNGRRGRNDHRGQKIISTNIDARNVKFGENLYFRLEKLSKINIQLQSSKKIKKWHIKLGIPSRTINKIPKLIAFWKAHLSN